MAGFEDVDPTASTVEKKPILKTTSRIEGGQYVGQDLERYDNSKTVANDRPVRCNGTTNCTLPAIVRPNFPGSGEKNLCQRHWDKVKDNTDSYMPGPFWIKKGTDNSNAIRVEDAKETARGRIRDNSKIFDVTGIHVLDQGPGRPIKPEDTEEDSATIVDHVTPVIDRAATGGGHIKQDHEAKLYSAHQALLSSIDAGGGEPHGPTYHKFLSKTMPDQVERNEYFIHAMNHHKKIMGRSVVPKKHATEAASAEFNQNYSYNPEGNSFDEITDLMSNDFAPTRAESGLRGQRSDD
jgi:hypothetical protein